MSTRRGRSQTGDHPEKEEEPNWCPPGGGGARLVTTRRRRSLTGDHKEEEEPNW